MKIINKKRFSLAVLILIILIILVIRGIGKIDKKEAQEVSKTNTTQEENVESTPVKRDLNNLKEDEASFGQIDKPVYKKEEKEIKLPIMIYHAFKTPEPEDDKYKLYSTEARFEENVTTLLNDGYTFITLEDLYKYNQGKIGLPEKNITITMDDGWIGCYTEAFNVAKKYNIPITIFIVENLVGSEDYFSWEQAKEMYDTGLVKIHVHGQRHINATDYSNTAQLVKAYNETHSLIEEKLGAKLQKIMAYPAGKSSEKTISALKEAGFEVQVQTKYGTVNKSTSLNLTNLGRIGGERASGQSILKTINSK